MESIIDYGLGNTGSILNMIHHIGGKAVITKNTEIIQSATALVLPGV